MDELSLLRRIRADVPEASTDALRRGRAALLERAQDAPVAPPAKRRHPVRWFGLGALGVGGAAAVVLTLVATNILGLAGWRGGADAAAADVLDKAALATITSSDPVLQPGQYLLVGTDAVYRATLMADGGEWDANKAVTYLTISHDELYIPADRSDDWVWVRGLTEPYKSFSDEGARLAQEQYARMLAETGGEPELLRAPRGEFYGSAGRYGDLGDLPRDPQQLLNYIYKATLGAGRSADGEALVWIADTLRTGRVPADLRAALYRAAAGIPGVEITEQAANLDGRTGISIGRVENVDGTRQDIIIDPATGSLIGEREVLVREALGLPAGTTTAFTAVTTSVADSAPAGGTPNGRLDRDGCRMIEPGHFQC